MRNSKKLSWSLGREWEIQKNFPAFWDGNGKVKKTFLLFGTETANPKKLSCNLETGNTCIPVGKYSGTGFPAHTWVLRV